MAIVSFKKEELTLNFYKERQPIELLFKTFKTSGFNLEQTHLKDIDRMEKFLSRIMIVFASSYATAIYIRLTYTKDQDTQK